MTLEALGWSATWARTFSSLQPQHPDAQPARVTSATRERYTVLDERGERDALLAGRLRHDALDGALPAVGDWVAVLKHGERDATIVETLPRRSVLARKRVGLAARAQVLAANLDYVWLVTSLNRDLNLRRIERTLAMIWDGGAQPVIVLSKADLCSDVPTSVSEVENVALGVPVHAIAIATTAGAASHGLSALDGYMRPGVTLAVIGSSGVGKSTLCNHLLGQARIATASTRQGDDKGRHTTSAQEMFRLPSGALLVDTAGMREIGLLDASEGVDATFADIHALSSECRFADCKHEAEPGCAIRRAIEGGQLEAARFASYQKLQRELAHDARRADPKLMEAHREQIKRVMRERTRTLRSKARKH